VIIDIFVTILFNGVSVSPVPGLFNENNAFFPWFGHQNLKKLFPAYSCNFSGYRGLAQIDAVTKLLVPDCCCAVFYYPLFICTLFFLEPAQKTVMVGSKGTNADIGS
jgi:hypothetical protein